MNEFGLKESVVEKLRKGGLTALSDFKGRYIEELKKILTPTELKSVVSVLNQNNIFLAEMPLTLKRSLTALKKAGYAGPSAMKGKHLEDIVEIKGISKEGAKEVKKYLKNLGIVITNRPKQKDENFEIKRGVIDRFIKVELKDSYDKSVRSTVWSRNMRTVNDLFKKYPDPKFWQKFSIGFRLNSLNFFYSEKGKEILQSAWGKHKLAQESVEIEEDVPILEEEKVGEDIQFERPKDLRDFLNL